MPSSLPPVIALLRPAPKPWFRSRTLWFNAVLAALGAAELAIGGLQTVLPGDVYTWLAFALAVGNAVLRVVTSQPLGSGSPPNT